MMMKLSTTLVALVLLAGPVFAQATGGEGRGGRLAACRADVAQFCQGVEAGRGKKFACLAENKAKLTPECAAVVEARGAKGERKGGQRSGRDAAGQKDAAPAGAAVDAPPAATGPAATGPAAGRLAAGEAAKKRRDAGAGQDNAAKTERRQKMAACRTDYATFCQNVEKGGGRRIKCLKDNEAKLSPECKAAVSSLPERGAKGRRADAEAGPVAR